MFYPDFTIKIRRIQVSSVARESVAELEVQASDELRTIHFAL
jgi:hypothetical protein